MKLRAKIILTAASLALSCALLAGCGSSSGSTASSAASSEPASTVLSQASSIPLGEDTQHRCPERTVRDPAERQPHLQPV